MGRPEEKDAGGWGRVAALLLVVFAAANVARGAWAQGESQLEDDVAPESVEGLEAPMGQPVEEPPRRFLPRFGTVADKLKDLPLLQGSTLEVQLRSYYMYGRRKSNHRREAWVYGGWVKYRSDWLRDRLRVGATFYLSQPIHAPSERDGTRLLRERQRQYAVLGESYAELKLAELHQLTLYRKTIDSAIPYVNRRDNRMTPTSFERYTVQGRFARGDDYPTLDYIAGYIPRIKERNSDRFISMGEQASEIGDPKRGLWIAGLNLELRPGFKIAAIDQRVHDLFNTFFATIERNWSLPREVGARLHLQYTDQRSIGDDLLSGSAFRTHIWSGSLSASYRSAIVHLAFSSTGSNQKIRSPYGSKPSPLNLMLRSFDRADEDGWLIGASYDFARIGAEGLSAFVNYARGIDAKDDGGIPINDQYELNATIDYRFQTGVLRGLWLRLRGAFVKERHGGDSRNELRVIVNYTLPIL